MLLHGKGNSKEYGFDYIETYAFTPVPEVNRFLLTFSAYKDMKVHHMDVDCTYLNAPLDKTVCNHVLESLLIINQDKF